MVLGCIAAYRETMASFATMRDLEVWYASPQEMEIDRHFAELERRLARLKPRRVVIDSPPSTCGTSSMPSWH
jgi:hypothetical protein